VHTDRALLCGGEFEFAIQAVHDASVVCPVATPYLPTPQVVHDASAVCPVATPYLPAPQSEQLTLPAPSDLNLPATHAEHVPVPASPPYPELQVQFARALLSEGEIEFGVQVVQEVSPDPPVPTRYFPTPQAVQDASVVCPVASPYLPATQSVQSPFLAADLYFPFAHTAQLPPVVFALPEYPTLQVHSVKTALPAGEFEYIGHDLHVELVEAPFASEYVCGPHSTHVPTVEAPTAVEYFPASHVMHSGIPLFVA
jgi:hypothetical protein